MTRLRKMMLEELERRNYSEANHTCYIRTVEDFLRRFKRSPDCLGRNTSVNIKPSCSSSASCRLVQSRNDGSSAILLHQNLKKAWSIAETPYPKKSVPFLRSSARKKSATHRRSSVLLIIALC